MTAPPFKRVFPADNDLALFTMSMSMAGNDVEHAIRQAVAANTESRPDFGYWVRVANGFTFEGTRTLKAWRQLRPEVAGFLKTLSADGRKHLKQVEGLEQRLGRGALEEVRQQTFHYPRPDPGHNPDSADRLREVLKSHENGLVEIDQLQGGGVRFTFADDIALSLALGKHLPPDDPEFMNQAEEAMNGSIAFANLVKDIVVTYFKRHGVAVQ